jgi:glycosyltransferase involved in cell wall biosynthesis
MRVAIVSEVFYPAIDGVVTRLTRTIEQLGAAGDDVIVVAPAGGPSEYAGAPVVGVRALPMPLYPDGPSYPPKRVALPNRQMARILRDFRPDVIHAVNPVLLAAGAVAVARRRRVPLVASYHAHLLSYAPLYKLGWIQPAGWRYLRALHNSAQVNLATSNSTLAQLRERGFDRLHLWPYGIDTERFDPGKRSERWRERLSGGRPERQILLYVGRLAREKTVERLLEAVSASDRVALAIVGDGPERGELEERFAGTPTTFLGFQSGEDLAAAYASADIFVMPSQTETLGLVMLEAHASGLPVIAADSPASRELVNDTVDGLRFDPAVPGALAGIISGLIDDPQKLVWMSRQARRATAGADWRGATAALRGHYMQASQEHESDGLAAAA